MDDHDWSLGDSYDPRDFYYSATNKRGFDKDIRVAIPASIKSGLGEIIAKRLFPFRGEQDLLRYCLASGLANLSKLTPDPLPQDLLDLVKTQARVQRMEDEKQAKRDIIDRVNRLLIGGTDTEQTEAIVMARECMLSEKDPWFRDQWKNIIKNHHARNFQYMHMEEIEKDLWG